MTNLVSGDMIKLDNDSWADLGKTYLIHAVRYRENSTAVELTLEDESSNYFTRVIASHQIIKV